MSGYTFREMILAGWPVLSILLLMSIMSLTIILDRVAAYRRARMNVRAFVAVLINIIRAQGPVEALIHCQRISKPAARVAADIIAQSGGREAKERAAQHALQAQIIALQAFVPVLGTVGSTAPFIGLFGTVMGIIKAFQDIAISSAAGPEVVSAGIAEALITTAFGLLVAIPAVMAYNYCVHQTQKFAQEIDWAVFDLIECLTGEPR